MCFTVDAPRKALFCEEYASVCFLCKCLLHCVLATFAVLDAEGSDICSVCTGVKANIARTGAPFMSK